jgi:hypothetical protein
MVWLVSCISFGSGCAKTREEDLQAKVDKCTAAGMNYTYMRDFKGDPYEVMCIPKRLR